MLNEAAIITTGPDAISAPTTQPPTTCPCPPAKYIVNPDAAAGAGGGRNDPAKDKISKRPCRVAVAPDKQKKKCNVINRDLLAQLYNSPIFHLELVKI